MNTASVAIVGGGLSGLYAAYLLEQRGIKDYVLFEARGCLGGRIASASAVNGVPGERGVEAPIDRFDLGPTWFWPGIQPQLDQLIRELGLERFEQFETGDMMVERTPSAPPQRMQGYLTSPASMRLRGGMGALTDALCGHLDAGRIFISHAVRRIRADATYIELDTEDSTGRSIPWHAEHVLLAIPPRLLAGSIEFSPALPEALAQAWRATATWMAPHAKYVAVYDTPFWRDHGLSGEARSARGPLTEIHDASMPEGSGALFGFFGVPAQVRMGVSDEVLCSHCRAQFVRLFGTQAATPKAEFIKDWARDPYTATAADLDEAGHHGQAPPSTAGSGPWRERLTAIASEFSPQFPGYVAGAIEAATMGVERLPEHPG
ncbi:flavin monoamine oxidase family protein [Microbulbifer sp. SA54]|uniref:flavin monoamine oxidase family protein n=1 Tax=Microbulbifer sp. SA54 TaxID=3401577 RepID=UPI003AAD5D98